MKKNGFTALRITSSRNTTLEQKNSPFKKIFTPKKIIGRIQNVQSTSTKINFNLHTSGRRFLQRSTCFSLCCENNFLQLWTYLPFPGMKIENITPEDTLFGRIFAFFVARLTLKKNPTKKITPHKSWKCLPSRIFNFKKTHHCTMTPFKFPSRLLLFIAMTHV